MIFLPSSGAKAYADTSLAQLRNLVEVKDTEGFKSYLEGQKEVANELTERLKGDAEKVVALQQEFAQESQKLTESTVKQAQESAEQATETASKAVKEAAPCQDPPGDKRWPSARRHAAHAHLHAADAGHLLLRLRPGPRRGGAQPAHVVSISRASSASSWPLTGRYLNVQSK
jgi:phasin family protein